MSQQKLQIQNLQKQLQITNNKLEEEKVKHYHLQN